jgi:hypothetical protein
LSVAPLANCDHWRPYDVERARKVFADANERWRAERARASGS